MVEDAFSGFLDSRIVPFSELRGYNPAVIVA